MPAVALKQLLGQAEVADYLRGIVARGRYGNAYLFHGPAGVGKGTAALAFARAALCDRVPGARETAPRDEGPSLFGDAPAAAAAPAARDGDDACGECPACAKSASLGHPDLKFIFPVSGEEKEAGESIIEQTAKWREDPLFTFEYERAASVRLFQTRELQRELTYHPFESSRRVVVIRDCDRMREDQYSALLKSIEEPGAATIWVLTTSRLARVPATIRSRCQRVRFAPLPEVLVRDFLGERAGCDETTARMLAALSGGSLARALSMRDGDARAKRDEALALLEPALRGDARGLWAAVAKTMNFGRTNREGLRRILEYHQLWLRDLLRARYGADREDLVHRDREKAIRAQAETTDATEIRRRLMVLEEALRSIDGNISADLTLFSVMMRVAGRRTGEGAWPAHSTARWDY